MLAHLLARFSEAVEGLAEDTFIHSQELSQAVLAHPRFEELQFEVQIHEPLTVIWIVRLETGRFGLDSPAVNHSEEGT